MTKQRSKIQDSQGKAQGKAQEKAQEKAQGKAQGKSPEELKQDSIQVLEQGETARRSAIILHLTSLPSPFGIGVIGEEAIQFAQKLAESETAYWQILPLYLPIDNSPYNSLSTFAGNTMLIDPRGLVAMGLLTENELSDFYYPGPPHSVDYNFVRKNSQSYLQRAFKRLKPEQKDELEAFIQKQDWIANYATFRVLKDSHQDVWWKWPLEIRAYSTDIVKKVQSEEAEAFYFYCFGQWLFQKQWQHLREACHELGVGILGDIPYYVAADGADTWSNAANFQLNDDLSPAWVAGVPPDYYAAEGQLWGNTVYDWDAMEENGYTWWIARLKAAFELYDALRLDHFRGFEAYWRVDAKAKTARKDSWQKGPGMKLFTALRDALGPLPIIAEDLGELTPGVYELIEESGFPGMKVLQFAFDSHADNIDQPHHYDKNLCVYTGTHDNDTLLGWVWATDERTRKYVLHYLGLPEDMDWGKGGFDSPFCNAMIRLAWSSVARLAACPFQDLMGFGTDTRMNTPGKVEGQWEYRITQDNLAEFPVKKLYEFNKLYGREGSYLVDEEDAELADEIAHINGKSNETSECII